MFKRRYFKKRKVPLYHERETLPVPITGAGAIWADGLYDGRTLPVLVLDTSSRQDVEDLINIHQNGPPGDIDAAWGKNSESDGVLLHIKFHRPMALNIILEFDIGVHGLLLDQMIDVRAFYIQSGSPGTKISDNPDTSRIVVGLPDNGFRPHWKNMLKKYIVKLFRQKGKNRVDSKIAADNYLKAWDEAKRTPDGLNAFLG